MCRLLRQLRDLIAVDHIVGRWRIALHSEDLAHAGLLDVLRDLEGVTDLEIHSQKEFPDYHVRNNPGDKKPENHDSDVGEMLASQLQSNSAL